VLRWRPAYVGIGSNLGDPWARVHAAFSALARLPRTRLVSGSPVYESVPFGPVVQPAFHNAVAGLLTQLDAGAMLAELLSLQRQLGREGGRVRWGPREIDLDLLVLGDEQIASQALTLPHPGIPERDFVLYPLRDIAPDMVVPGIGPVRDLAARVTDRGMRRLAIGAGDDRGE
jgi:2-amino-4-hydroxy-6-hydroxymethyldihydropteridine diphosphokinase